MTYCEKQKPLLHLTSNLQSFPKRLLYSSITAYHRLSRRFQLSWSRHSARPITVMILRKSRLHKEQATNHKSACPCFGQNDWRLQVPLTAGLIPVHSMKYWICNYSKWNKLITPVKSCSFIHCLIYSNFKEYHLKVRPHWGFICL